jgi:hypothetical protein
LAILLITLNSQAVATLIQADFAYWFKSDNSHLAASSASWNEAHHQARFNACNAVFAVLGNALAAILQATNHSAGAVKAISVVSSHKVSQTSYAHTSSVSIHSLNKSSELACLCASFQSYHLACFILSHAVHSDTSAHNKSATQYHISHNQAATLLHIRLSQAHIVFCARLAAHCKAHLVQALNLSQAFIKAHSTHHNSHNFAANHLLS